MSRPAASTRFPHGHPERASGPELTFPDLPQLQLEELLGQLTTRAQEVLNAQGRLRALLRANAVVASDLSLPIVLHHIVTAARELVGAGYAALWVIDADGTLEQFVHDGVDRETVERIGQLPRGHGILGLLGNFLDVPIRVGEQVFGNLYLTESCRGQFNAEDEQLVTALAATAGVAIDNARLHAQTEQQRQWLAASTEVTKALFAGDSDQPLRLVLDHAARVAGADYAMMMMPTGPGQLRVEAGVGTVAAQLTGRVLSLDSTLAGRAIQTGKPALLGEDAAQLDDLVDAAGSPTRAGRAVAAPLLADDGAVLGAILVARRAEHAKFTEADLTQLADFASHAGVALALDGARADSEAARTLADHDRIAVDLHDDVIQELFAIGMGLEGMVHAASAADQKRLMDYVGALDATICRIRSTIFCLHDSATRAVALQQRIFGVLDQQRLALGFAAGIEFAGPLDLGVPPALADVLIAVVRQALSDVARYAHARTACVRIALADGLLSLDITDDGDGDRTRSSGVADLRHRARAHHGGLTICSLPEGGTQLHWTARVAAS